MDGKRKDIQVRNSGHRQPALSPDSNTTAAIMSEIARLQGGDVAIAVTAPFKLPYAVAAAAKLKRARSALMIHDLYPDVGVMAGLLKSSSVLAGAAMRGVNALIFEGWTPLLPLGATPSGCCCIIED